MPSLLDPLLSQCHSPPVYSRPPRGTLYRMNQVTWCDTTETLWMWKGGGGGGSSIYLSVCLSLTLSDFLSPSLPPSLPLPLPPSFWIIPAYSPPPLSPSYLLITLPLFLSRSLSPLSSLPLSSLPLPPLLLPLSPPLSPPLPPLLPLSFPLSPPLLLYSTLKYSYNIPSPFLVRALPTRLSPPLLVTGSHCEYLESSSLLLSLVLISLYSLSSLLSSHLLRLSIIY